ETDARIRYEQVDRLVPERQLERPELFGGRHVEGEMPNVRIVGKLVRDVAIGCNHLPASLGTLRRELAANSGIASCNEYGRHVGAYSLEVISPKRGSGIPRAPSPSMR